MIKANGQDYQLQPNTRLVDFLNQMNLAPERVIIERNKVALTTDESKNVILENGDNLEIVKIVAGG